MYNVTQFAFIKTVPSTNTPLLFVCEFVTYKFQSMVLIFLVISSLLALTQQDQRILYTPDGVSQPPHCVLACSGGGNATWKDSAWYIGRAVTDINIANCGFVSQPIVIASIIVPSAKSSAPPSALSLKFNDKRTAIWAYTESHVTADNANNKSWELHWTAFGYVC